MTDTPASMTPASGQNPDRLPVATGKRTLAVLWERLRGHRGVLVFSAVISTVAVVFDLVTPSVLGTVVDDVSGRADGRPAEHPCGSTPCSSPVRGSQAQSCRSTAYCWPPG